MFAVITKSLLGLPKREVSYPVITNLFGSRLTPPNQLFCYFLRKFKNQSEEWAKKAHSLLETGMKRATDFLQWFYRFLFFSFLLGFILVSSVLHTHNIWDKDTVSKCSLHFSNYKWKFSCDGLDCEKSPYLAFSSRAIWWLLSPSLYLDLCCAQKPDLSFS